MNRVQVPAVLLAAAVACAPLVPPLHVHETEAHGQHHLLVHRHLAEHRLAPAPAAGTHVEDDDAPVLTLSAIYTLPTPPVSVAAPPAELVALVDPPAAPSLPRHVPFVEPLIHGPPRAPASLRAPPLSPAV